MPLINLSGYICNVISLESNKDQTGWMIKIQKHIFKGFRSNTCLKSHEREIWGEWTWLVPICVGEQVALWTSPSTSLQSAIVHPTLRPYFYFDFLISDFSSTGITWQAWSCVCSYMVSLAIRRGTIWPVKTEFHLLLITWFMGIWHEFLTEAVGRRWWWYRVLVMI